MIYKNTAVGGTVEFLAADDFVAIPFKLAADNSGTAVGVVKAGTPVLSTGLASSTGQSCIGIVLYDTDTARNPNCAILKQGVVDLKKMKSHSGLSGITAAYIQAALPGVVVREDIGVNS